MMMPKVLFVLLSLCFTLTSSKTYRYRNGVSDGESSVMEEQTMSIPAARQKCNLDDKCVSFSFKATTRFPEGDDIPIYFFEHADWHVRPTTGQITFVENPSWHTYINSTRELDLITPEIEKVLAQIMKMKGERDENSPPSSKSKLRGKRQQTSDASDKPPLSDDDQFYRFLSSFYEIVTPKPHRVIAAPMIAPHAVDIAGDSTKSDAIRIMAMNLLMLLGDSYETGNILISSGVYNTMKAIVMNSKVQNNNNGAWNRLTETALDVIANICFYRTANSELRKLGAVEFLKQFVSIPGFPGLQSSMALMHLEDDGDTETVLDKATVKELMYVLRSAIDGDIAHGISWDLTPGPLSAIQYYLKHGNDPEYLLDEGLMEQLLQILEESENSEELFTSLEVMMSLMQSSERAKDMILLADHSIKDMAERLASFQKAIDLAGTLSHMATTLVSLRNEL